MTQTKQLEDRIFNRKDPSAMYDGMRVVAFAMEKGGTGKTTLAILFAIRAALGYYGAIKKKVLFIDVDPQQNASKTLLKMETVSKDGACIPPVHPSYDPNDPDDVHWGGRSNSIDLYYDNIVLPYPSLVSDNLEVLPADGNALNAFISVEKSSNKTVLEHIYEQMHKFCDSEDVKAEYDLIVFDCPPGVTLVTTPVIRAATDIALPFDGDLFGMDGTHKMIHQIKKENSFRICDLNILGIFPNKVSMKLNRHKANVKAMRDDPDIGQYMAGIEIPNLNGLCIQEMPITNLKSHKLSDKNAEKHLQIFLDYMGEKMHIA
jgi:chromosome partitioning protein